MSRRRSVLLIVAAALIALYLTNASWVARPDSARPRFLAHRGVHQQFSREGLANDTCTASRMLPGEHRFLENTIPSIEAAFESGADVVELDIHPTTDGQFAVFHDWKLDCRTDGTGVTREQTMAYLKSLDVGHGYTADGVSFPLRGSGIGLMPALTEVLDAFPERRLLIHIKSDDPNEGDLLARALRERTAEQRARLMVYGGARPVRRVVELIPELRVFTRTNAKSCLTRYALAGWTGYVPDACRRSLLLVPANYAGWLWGWPHRFLARMESAGTEVFLAGALDAGGSTGIDSEEELAELLRDHYSGGIWTNRIEIVGL